MNKEEYILKMMSMFDFAYEDCEELLQLYIVQMKAAFIEIDEYIAREDFGSLASKFHQLKGTSGNLRLTDISDQMVVAEEAAKESNLSKIKEIINQIKTHEIFQG